jgi:hypothetical protein
MANVMFLPDGASQFAGTFGSALGVATAWLAKVPPYFLPPEIARRVTCLQSRLCPPAKQARALRR